MRRNTGRIVVVFGSSSLYLHFHIVLFSSTDTRQRVHELSERGRSLSAGERQLIALARAELVDPVVLLLDEATSNLDLATEARVAAAMRRVAASRTTVVIAHRLQTARAADRIAVLEGGRIAELGSHDELLAADGRYAGMWKAFASTDGPARTRSS